MASLFQRSGGSWSIQFDGVDGRRKTLSLGKVTKRTAEGVRLKVENLVAANLAGGIPDAETVRWVAAAGEKMIDRLAAVGLVETRPKAMLGPFIDQYVDSRRLDPAIKPSTIAATAAAYKSLREYFGDDKLLRTITKGDAKAWRTNLAAEYADNTVRKRTAQAKTLFRAAIDHELIDRNPFDGLKSTLVENRARDYFVTRDEADKVLAACPTLEWRLIFALCRFGGLRCPSEVLALRWGDVLWDQSRLVIRCVKTAHHEGRDTRVMPLFPELEPLLSQAFAEAPDGAEYVVARTRDTATNLRTTMAKIIERAGLTPWPKLFQNLRATRATELADAFPGHVAAAWLGHTVEVAKGHYWQVTDEHFEDALKFTPAPQPKALHEALQQAPQPKRTEPKRGLPIGLFAEFVDSLQKCTGVQVGDTGLEPVTSTV